MKPVPKSPQPRMNTAAHYSLHLGGNAMKMSAGYFLRWMLGIFAAIGLLGYFLTRKSPDVFTIVVILVLVGFIALVISRDKS